METGGYKNRSRILPKAELHALITERLGVSSENITCEYGMSELSSQAYDSGTQSRIFHFPPWARVQILSPETGREVAEGETGLIRIFLDLANVFFRGGDPDGGPGHPFVANGFEFDWSRATGRTAGLLPDDRMNLPNFFLADLPPEAVLTPADDLSSLLTP